MRGFADGHHLRLKFRTSGEPWPVPSAKVNDYVSSSLSGLGDVGVMLLEDLSVADALRSVFADSQDDRRASRSTGTFTHGWAVTQHPQDNGLIMDNGVWESF